MSSSIGIYASQISGHLVTNNYSSIATLNGTGSSGTITFSSIPSTYTHLQIRYIARSDGSGGHLRMRTNGDTGSNYTIHFLKGDGTSASAYGTGGTSFMGDSPYLYSGFLTNAYQAGIIDTLDYANVNKYKTIRTLLGQDNNGGGNAAIELWSGLWQSTSAISSITLYMDDSSNFTTASQFALYGIR
jgi:hypothetical protein